MTRETYLKITGVIREHPGRIRLTRFLNKLLTGFVFALYPIFLLLLFVRRDPFLLRAVFVPAVSFALVTVFRRLVNTPRPYEKFDIPPVLEKDTRGKSFPSRHVFSVFIIALTIFCLYPGAGILLGVAGVILGLIRVIGGVHEPKDVLAGAVIGILCGVVGFYVI